MRIEHWLACGADGQTDGRAVYGHVITKFSGMGRFTYPWCSAGGLRPPELRYKIPDTPWSKVGQDLFTYGSETFLVTVDYYSDYFELDLLQDATTESVIKATKSHFAQHGIADMITDNGPQYSSD